MCHPGLGQGLTPPPCFRTLRHKEGLHPEHLPREPGRILVRTPPGGLQGRDGGGQGPQPHPCHLSLTTGLQLDFSVLNPNGPFVLLNPISRLLAGETQVLMVSFSPREDMLVSPRPALCHAPQPRPARRALGPDVTRPAPGAVSALAFWDPAAAQTQLPREPRQTSAPC